MLLISGWLKGVWGEGGRREWKKEQRNERRGGEIGHVPGVGGYVILDVR